MSAAVETAPSALFEAAENEGRTTLAERLDAAVAQLEADGRAACPVCEGPLEPAPFGGRCGDCGSRLR